MIDNYLQEARLRFDKDKELKALQNAERWRKEHDRSFKSCTLTFVTVFRHFQVGGLPVCQPRLRPRRRPEARVSVSGMLRPASPRRGLATVRQWEESVLCQL